MQCGRHERHPDPHRGGERTGLPGFGPARFSGAGSAGLRSSGGVPSAVHSPGIPAAGSDLLGPVAPERPGAGRPGPGTGGGGPGLHCGPRGGGRCGYCLHPHPGYRANFVPRLAQTGLPHQRRGGLCPPCPGDRLGSGPELPVLWRQCGLGAPRERRFSHSHVRRALWGGASGGRFGGCAFGHPPRPEK